MLPLVDKKRMQVPQGLLCWLPPEEHLTFLRAHRDLGLVKAQDSVVENLLSVLVQDEPQIRRKLERDGQVPSEAPGQAKLKSWDL